MPRLLGARRPHNYVRYGEADEVVATVVVDVKPPEATEPVVPTADEVPPPTDDAMPPLPENEPVLEAKSASKSKKK